MDSLRKKVFDEENWKDITHEIYRVYEFLDGKQIKIEKPILVKVSESGGHRILDSNNIAHYIPPKWVHLYWETDDGTAFRF